MRLPFYNKLILVSADANGEHLGQRSVYTAPIRFLLPTAQSTLFSGCHRRSQEYSVGRQIFAMVYTWAFYDLNQLLYFAISLSGAEKPCLHQADPAPLFSSHTVGPLSQEDRSRVICGVLHTLHAELSRLSSTACPSSESNPLLTLR